MLAVALLAANSGVCPSELNFWSKHGVNNPQAPFAFELWLTSNVDPTKVKNTGAGLLTLVGNQSAHKEALACTLHEKAPLGTGPRHLLDRDPSTVSCADGCKDLVQQVAWMLKDRDGVWTTVFIEHADKAPTSQLNLLVTKFVAAANPSRCEYAGSEVPKVVVDCSKVLFVLSSGLITAYCLLPT